MRQPQSANAASPSTLRMTAITSNASSSPSVAVVWIQPV